jgi:hypothetical protein
VCPSLQLTAGLVADPPVGFPSSESVLVPMPRARKPPHLKLVIEPTAHDRKAMPGPFDMVAVPANLTPPFKLEAPRVRGASW